MSTLDGAIDVDVNKNLSRLSHTGNDIFIPNITQSKVYVTSGHTRETLFGDTGPAPKVGSVDNCIQLATIYRS